MDEGRVVRDLVQIVAKAVEGAIPSALGNFLNAVADVIKGFLSFMNLIQELASSKKIEILIWGGINNILSVLNSCLIAATTIAKPKPKIQIPLAIVTSGLNTAEFFTGLSHAIVDAAVPGSSS